MKIRRLIKCLLLGLIVISVFSPFISRTEGFVHTFITPKYVKEATSFYHENQQNLDMLLKFSSEMTTGVYYQFQHSEDTTDEIPLHLLEILQDLEQKTEKPYEIFLSQNEIEVIIKSSGSYEIILTGGKTRSIYGVTEKWEQSTALNNDWAVQSPYLQRG